ncbi:MAG: stage II sporulation protein D [Clostridia bacterium]|nr:stage II sporulation protein D [Clostridia bacterium]
MRFTAFLTLCLALSMIFTPLISIKAPTKSPTEGKTVSATQVNHTLKEEKITILRSESGKKETLPMRDYIVGVVSAEISPFYSDEAIKAQAVAAHTYALYQISHDVQLTDNYKKHQGYISPEEAKEKWGEKYEIYSKKITSQVDEVMDKVITYDGEIILPAYFALCSGRTENCEDIWGGEKPYLVSVTSTGDALSEDLISTVTVSAEEFNEFSSFDSATVPVISLDCTEGGAVKIFTINGKEFSGNEIQSAFGLKSNNFTVKYADESFIFTVTGNGHGVGMSQYGADFMARQGSTYEEILKHYYTGVKIEEI